MDALIDKLLKLTLQLALFVARAVVTTIGVLLWIDHVTS